MAVHGTHGGAGGSAVVGEAASGTGVSGFSTTALGVDAKTDSGQAALRATHTGDGGPGILGLGKANGVIGRCTGDGFSGVFGESKTGPGVSGSSTSSVGVDAKTESGPAALRAVHAGASGSGVLGISKANGVIGECAGDGFAGVFGVSRTGRIGTEHFVCRRRCKDRHGTGRTSSRSYGRARLRCSGNQQSQRCRRPMHGRRLLRRVRRKPDRAGRLRSSSTSVGVDAKSANGPAALRATHGAGGWRGLFVGDVRVSHDVIVDHDIEVKGDINLANGDCAEEFDVVERWRRPGL